MKLYENMILSELLRERDNQQAIINRTSKRIDAIHGQKDYSDDVAKHFHLGMVGFRKDRKRVNQTLDKAINNGVEACALYEERDSAQSTLDRIVKLIAKVEAAPEGVRETCTPRSLDETARKKALDSAPAIPWERVDGGYRHGEYLVKKVDDTVFLYRNGQWNGRFYKTVREAKAVVALAVARKEATT